MTIPRRILFLENGVSGGGSFVGLAQIVTHLDRQAFDPLVVFVNETPFVERLRSAGVTTIVLRDPLYSMANTGSLRHVTGYLRALGHRMGIAVPHIERGIHGPTMRALTALMRAMNVSILHCNNNPIRDYYGIAAAHQLRIPCVSHMRSLRIGNASRRLAPAMISGVARFVANSQHTATFWAERVGVPRSHTVVIPNAVSMDIPAPIDIHGWWTGGPRVVIGCVANFTDGKGQEFLLEAFADAARRFPRLGLLFVGDGPRRPLVERRAHELGCRASVVFAGYDERARAIIAACDVLAVPSATEAFGRTALEAMATGTPIIATRVGGLPELVTHGTNGLLVDYGDTRALADGMLRLVCDADFAQRCVAAGRRTVDQWSIVQHVRALSSLYEEVLTARVSQPVSLV